MPMKKLSMVLITLLPIVATAAAQPSLAFPEQKIGLPPLSLTEIVKPGPLSLLGDAKAWFRSKSLPVVAAKNFVSNMPIVSPKGDIDTKMVKSPDSSIDYKLIVKVPVVEPKK
jgi:hypothetical protein